MYVDPISNYLGKQRDASHARVVRYFENIRRQEQIAELATQTVQATKKST